MRALLADLEQQADGQRLAERDLEVAELGRAEFAQLGLEACLRGSLGRRVQVTVLGVGQLEGVLRRVGQGWLHLGGEAGAWWVTVAGLGGVRGLSGRPAPPEGVADRLGLGSQLRAAAEAGGGVVLHRLDATAVVGTLTRVGADFVAVRSGEGVGAREELLPFTALAAVRSGR